MWILNGRKEEHKRKKRNILSDRSGHSVGSGHDWWDAPLSPIFFCLLLHPCFILFSTCPLFSTKCLLFNLKRHIFVWKLKGLVKKLTWIYQLLDAVGEVWFCNMYNASYQVVDDVFVALLSMIPQLTRLCIIPVIQQKLNVQVYYIWLIHITANAVDL